MGLLYPFPVNTQEDESFIKYEKDSDNKPKSLTLKTYGLPYVFWFYLFSILITIIVMFIAIKDPILKLYNTEDLLNKLISGSCMITLLVCPIALISFFFYQKIIIRNKSNFIIKHNLYGLTFKSIQIEINHTDENFLFIHHFIDSPNIAKIEDERAYKLFQNKGYFELYILDKKQRKVLLDRSSRKIDLEKIKDLLTSI
jgi:hypothetical protein